MRKGNGTEVFMARSFRLSIDSEHNPIAPLFKHTTIATVAIFTILAALYWFAAGSTRLAFSTDCVPLDESASANVASLVGDYSRTAEARLADAMFRLKRARSHCRNGWLALARQDYNALINGRYGRRE